MKKLSRLKKLTLCSSLIFSLCACSKDSEKIAECPPTIDTVEILLTKHHKDKEYYLVERISGWHDKTTIIQLFDKKPHFGECNEDLVKPIFEDSIELEKSLAKISIDLNNKQYKLVYGDLSHTKINIELEFTINK